MSQRSHNIFLYNQASFETSMVWTKQFSSSFFQAAKLLDEPIRTHVFNIYGLVRLADEIVDSWRPAGMSTILDDLEKEVFIAIKRGFSTNPIVHAFAVTANDYKLKQAPIKAFFSSMRMDITKQQYSQKEYDKYIYGSAQAVGLMCLSVFTTGNEKHYARLKQPAMALGAAFQKVNFLRDLGSDNKELSRCYFPNVDFNSITYAQYQQIISDIQKDFDLAKTGVAKLPSSSRYAVALALAAYQALLAKLTKCDPSLVATQRLRVSRRKKLQLFLRYRLVKSFGG